ncbi:hypothetical protein K2173_020929 [Erythroxylum novogranatense]|uniref:Bifunctional inhibitor/plant lipid transfer protein/seed storage helical domain-containing protein n=1 Tax=Erythroxylum novogranatense TaxID=1862640 RepID=A0AAV8TPH8_9ROSI|nr:hypothetical protein K2173_020929 [Erythroxylum novogranatense]
MALGSSVVVLLFSVLVAAEAAGHHHAAAPAPGVECTNLVLSMADCLTYVMNGSTTTKPEKTCCSGLKTVLDTDAECLCEAFKNSAQFGVALNVSKALTLPAACKLHAPPASKCGLSLSPSGSPGAAPTLPAGGPSASSDVSTVAPAPAPKSGSSGLAISVSLVVGLMVVTISTTSAF